MNKINTCWGGGGEGEINSFHFTLKGSPISLFVIYAIGSSNTLYIHSLRISIQWHSLSQVQSLEFSVQLLTLSSVKLCELENASYTTLGSVLEGEFHVGLTIATDSSELCHETDHTLVTLPG